MKRRNLLLIVVLIGVPLATIYAVLVGALFGEYSSAKAAGSWVPVDARIVSSGTGRHMASRGGPYIGAEVSYRYSVNGRVYASTRLGYLLRERFEVSPAGQAEADRLVRDVARSSRAYYSPVDPAQSVLSIDHDYAAEFHRRWRALVVIGALGLVVMSGLLGLVFIVADRPGYLRGPQKRPAPLPGPVPMPAMGPKGRDPRRG